MCKAKETWQESHDREMKQKKYAKELAADTHCTEQQKYRLLKEACQLGNRHITNEYMKEAHAKAKAEFDAEQEKKEKKYNEDMAKEKQDRPIRFQEEDEMVLESLNNPGGVDATHDKSLNSAFNEASGKSNITGSNCV